MKNTVSGFIVSLIVAVFLTLSGTARAADGQTLERNFEVNPGGKLYLNSDIGSIRIQTAAQKKVNVRVDIRFDSWHKGDIEDFMQNFKVDFSQTGDDVRVTAKLRKKWMNHWNNMGVEFLVEVPRKYNLDVSTSGGSISVDDLEGELIAQTSGGSLHFGKIVGPVDGKTSGGSIQLEGCQGDAYIKTSGGSITVGEVEGDVVAHTSGGSISVERVNGSTDAKTSGGSITLREVKGTTSGKTSGGSVTAYISEQPEDNCSLETSGGTVTVYLASDIAAYLDAKTSSGKVNCDFQVQAEGKEDDHYLRGKMNGGGPELYLRTSGGNINLRKK